MFSDMKLIQINIVCLARTVRETALSVTLFVLLLLVSGGAATAWAGFQPDLMVKLAVEPDGAYLGGGVFESSPQLQSKSQAAFPGTAAAYRVMLRNAGDQADSFRLKVSAATGVALRFFDDSGVERSAELTAGFSTAQLAPGEVLVYQVQVTPLSFLLGSSFRVSLAATSAGDPLRVDQVKTETVACGSSAAVILSAPPDGFGAPGSVVNHPYTLTNAGNTTNSFALSAVAPAGWSAALIADDGAGGAIAGDAVRQAGENSAVTATGPLAPGASYRFFLVVTIPPQSSDGARADFQVSASGEGAQAADQVATSAVSATVLVAESVRNLTRGGAFSTDAAALPGDTLEYRMAVTNAGTLAASNIALTAPVPPNTVAVAGSLKIDNSPGGDGTPCAAAVCGQVGVSGGSIVAQLGEGASAATGGRLPAGKTLYVFFRVQVD
jgi:uncharacterized repeat protein (TIGR01451 family)